MTLLVKAAQQWPERKLFLASHTEPGGGLSGCALEKNTPNEMVALFRLAQVLSGKNVAEFNITAGEDS